MFTVIIAGGGYSALWIKYRLLKDTQKLYDLNAYDKAIQSLIWGVIAFLFSLGWTINITKSTGIIITDESLVMNIILTSPYIFFFAYALTILAFGLYLSIYVLKEKKFYSFITSIPSIIANNFGTVRIFVSIAFAIIEIIFLLIILLPLLGLGK